MGARTQAPAGGHHGLHGIRAHTARRPSRQGFQTVTGQCSSCTPSSQDSTADGLGLAFYGAGLDQLQMLSCLLRFGTGDTRPMQPLTTLSTPSPAEARPTTRCANSPGRSTKAVGRCLAP